MVIYSGFTHWKWWFSIVMLVYQRVNPIIIHRTIAKISTCRGRPISITWPVQNGPVSELRPRPKARWWQWKSLLWNIMGKMTGNYEKLREMMGDDVFVEWQLWEIFGQWASMGLMRLMWVHSMFRPNHIEGYQVGDGSKLLCQSPEIILKWPFLEVHWYLMVPKIVNPQCKPSMGGISTPLKTKHTFQTTKRTASEMTHASLLVPSHPALASELFVKQCRDNGEHVLHTGSIYHI